jgi:hypothetical protein|tara:strand:+ start:72 stop:608 length:537 start_codon:yes stop_codon:yes gene_type:complete
MTQQKIKERQSMRQSNPLHGLEKFDLEQFLADVSEYTDTNFFDEVEVELKAPENSNEEVFKEAVEGLPKVTHLRAPDVYLMMAYTDWKMLDETQEVFKEHIDIFTVDKLFPYVFIKVYRTSEFTPEDKAKVKVKVGKWENINRTYEEPIHLNEVEDKFNKTFFKRIVISKSQLEGLVK